MLIFNKLRGELIQEERYAAWLLLTEIGLLSKYEKENRTVKTCKKLSDSFFTSRRLDAEYYQPKYDYQFSHLREFATCTIGEFVEIRKSIEPGSKAYQESGVPFVRVFDLSKFGLSETTVHLNPKEFHNVIRPQKDTILLSKDGSVGVAYKVEEPLDVITSGAILHLSLKDKAVLLDYLTLVLNSPIVRLQTERDAGGSIIQHWKPSEIENVVKKKNGLCAKKERRSLHKIAFLRNFAVQERQGGLFLTAMQRPLGHVLSARFYLNTDCFTPSPTEERPTWKS